MVVASGQLPYQYHFPVPLRAPNGAWPGLNTPNIAASGDMIEAAMFVLNAELRKWDFDDLDFLMYQAYWHPDIASSGFEPKANGDTLVGRVGPTAVLLAVNNIEHMRENMLTLLDRYTNDSDYDRQDFYVTLFETAYPESPSGHRRIDQPFFPLTIFVIQGGENLRPPIESILGGDFITTTDMHWLGGSGIFFDIDCGEVIFNPFPFPRNHFFTNPDAVAQRFLFGPIYPCVQTTAGAIPSLVVDRYKTDLAPFGEFKINTNFDALASGLVQIDGYVLTSGTTMELVLGNDDNFYATLVGTDQYTDHIQGLRGVNNGDGKNDVTARCYRTQHPKASGLYRLITYNKKVNVPFTSIPSGFVSIWPQGMVTKASPAGAQILDNFIHGQEITITSDGGIQRDARLSTGLHVMDDAIWLSSNNNDGSGTLDSAGMFICSPHNGELVWYRPAELTVATSGNTGGGSPGTFQVHLGLSKFGTDFLRISKVHSQFTGGIGPTTFAHHLTHFQLYDQTTLDHQEISVNYSIIGPDATLSALGAGGFNGGCVFDEANNEVWIWSSAGKAHRFTDALAFDGAFISPIAQRRYIAAGGQKLYSVAGIVTAGDPIAGLGSGIGKWSVFSEPTPDIFSDVGSIVHDSAKPIRGETHFAHQSAATCRIHHIFDVIGATHVANGTWMIISFDQIVWLARIEEEATQWRVVESIRLEDEVDSPAFGSISDDFPIEGVLHQID